MTAVRIIFGIVIGALFGAASALALSPAVAAAMHGESAVGPFFVLAVIVIGAAFGGFAPSIRRAFGRSFLMLGVCTIALPLSAFLLSGRAFSEVVGAAAAEDQAFAAIGAGVGGALVTGVATFFGLILGAIFLITGLILSLGGRREVVIREAPQRRGAGGRREPPMTR